MWSWVVLCCLSEVLVVCYILLGLGCVHVVLSVLRSRSLSFVQLSMSCRQGCMLVFAMFMSVCGAVIVMSSAYLVSCTESGGSGMSEV